jgi:4-diphosphocytidyl-2-C-methyl-D-erythritol kinase
MLTLQTPAKINPVLEVIGPRPDGYHELALVFQAVGLYDVLTFEKKAQGVELVIEDAPDVLAADDSNLIVKAAKLFIQQFLKDKDGVKITLRKKIPMAAGMGGGSSDAAAALRGLQWLYEVEADEKIITSMAAGLGSDVPFFLTGGTALGTGRGEQITPWESPEALPVILVKTEQGLSTPAVYRSGKAVLSSGEKAKAFRSILSAGNPNQIASHLFNGLEPAAFSLRPDVEAVKKQLMAQGVLGALVSGSGPTVFALTTTMGEAAAISQGFHQKGLEVIVTQTISTGIVKL